MLPLRSKRVYVAAAGSRRAHRGLQPDLAASGGRIVASAADAQVIVAATQDAVSDAAQQRLVRGLTGWALTIGGVVDPLLTARPPLRGVIADWGGVMTNPITETVRAWIAADEIDYESYHAVMKAWVAGAYDVAGEDNPIHVLERGECSNEEFERMLAAQIVRRDGLPVAAEGLLDRMFAATVLSEPMQDLLRGVRRAGLKTALLSNSWGISAYPADLLAELFDAVVISAEVGMRKPEERIFLHAASLIGLEPAECVFIDDIEANIQAAEALGMTGVLHTGPAATAARLASLLGLG